MIHKTLRLVASLGINTTNQCGAWGSRILHSLSSVVLQSVILTESDQSFCLRDLHSFRQR